MLLPSSPKPPPKLLCATNGLGLQAAAAGPVNQQTLAQHNPPAPAEPSAAAAGEIKQHGENTCALRSWKADAQEDRT
jgi:hypothetical protein